MINPNNLIGNLIPIQADASGTATIPNINTQNTALAAGTKVYVQAFAINSRASNGLKITFLP